MIFRLRFLWTGRIDRRNRRIEVEELRGDLARRLGLQCLLQGLDLHFACVEIVVEIVGEVLCGIFPLNVSHLLRGVLLDELGDVNKVAFLFHAHFIILVELQDHSALSEEVDALRLSQEHYLKLASLVVRFQELC